MKGPSDRVNEFVRLVCSRIRVRNSCIIRETRSIMHVRKARRKEGSTDDGRSEGEQNRGGGGKVYKEEEKRLLLLPEG